MAKDSMSGTTPVREQHQFDVDALYEYLKGEIAGLTAPLEVEQFKGGQSNPTYKLTAGDRQFVLRRKPPGKLLKSAHAVDREYRVITALQGSDVPVAKTWCLCEDESVIGTAFYVMDFVDGRIFWDPSLPGLAAEERSAIYAEECRVIAALHQVDYGALGLSDYGRAGNYFERQIARWTKQYQASEATAIESMEKLIDWLPENIPVGDETSVVHGDYRLDNMIFHPTEPRVVAVLDWELSTLGHPLADFSYHCMTWRAPQGMRGLLGVDLQSLGIPSETAHVQQYCSAVGRPPIDQNDWDFYMAYNQFRLGGILQGIAGRIAAGTAASSQAQMMAAMAKPVADIGWGTAQQIIQRRG